MSRRQSFVKGAAVLSAASLIGKALSAVFKIPLDRFFIGAEGIAIYQNAYTIYNWLLAISATGIPLALSNLVAESDEEDAARLRSSAMWLVTLVCAVIAAALIILAEPIAVLITGGGEGQAAAAIRVMAVGVVFMGFSGAYKGYFQGRGDMLPSALSQIADSLCKACVGIAAAAALLPMGIEIASAGAMSGVSIGTAAGAAVLLIAGKKRIPVYKKPSLSAAKRVVLLAIPVTLGAAGFSCMMMADNFTVQRVLASNGYAQGEATLLFGHLTRCFMIYNLPATLISAITMSVAPACAEAYASDDRELLRGDAVSAFRLLMLVAAPCMLGCLGFSDEIFSLLYGESAGYGELLKFTGALMVLIPFTQVAAGILQATGCVWQPIIILGGALLIKILLNFILIPQMGITGSPLASIAAYFVACVAFLYLLRRYLKLEIPVGVFLRPLLAALGGLLFGRKIFSLIGGGTSAFIAGACVMAFIYVCLSVILGTIDIKQIINKKKL